MRRPLFLAVFAAASFKLIAQANDPLRDRVLRALAGSPERRASAAQAFADRNLARVESLLLSEVQAAMPAARTTDIQAVLGAVEFVDGNMEAALQDYRASDASKALDDADRFTMSMAMVRLGDATSARNELARLNAHHPDRALYLYWLARIDYDQRLYPSAAATFRRVLVLEPQSVRGWDNLGLSLDMMGLADEARAAFSKAVDLNRKADRPSPWPPHDYGYLVLRLDRFAEAEESFRESLRYDPQLALCHYHLGRALEKKGDDLQSMEEYREAARLDPRLAEPLYSLGLLYRRRGQEAEAAKAFEEYRVRKPRADPSLSAPLPIHGGENP